MAAEVDGVVAFAALGLDGAAARCCIAWVSETPGRAGVVTGRGAKGELALKGFVTGLGPMLLALGVVGVAAAGTTGRGAKGWVGFVMRGCRVLLADSG